ncbi:MAG: transglutaminase family protein [Alphaproteobacteria bacterium]|nr:transglutaminase family protein [Alphaproteobacteria bacterium]
MKIRIGYDIAYECLQPTPMLLMLSVHPSRLPDLSTPHRMLFDPPVAASDYRDGFGNTVTRILAPEGRIRIALDAAISDTGIPDPVAEHAQQHPVEELPDEVLVYLLGSRYCETDRLSDTAWSLFSEVAPGWRRVQAICDFANQHVAFGYEHARSTKTAWEGFMERKGVCRDFAHLAVTLCRCMNIPARYCTGYLGDIGVPASDAPMDFSAWFEAYLGERWYTFDARHNIPRIGRVLMATGRDAADVAISTSFGPCTLTAFSVITEEIAEPVPA